jgi:hypothetical protein
MRLFIIGFLIVVGLTACDKKEEAKSPSTSTETTDSVDLSEDVTLSTDATQT